MSKPARQLALFFFAAFLFTASIPHARGQQIEAEIAIGPGSSAAVRGKFLTTTAIRDRKVFSIETSSGDRPGNTRPITDLELFDVSGQKLQFRTLIDGEYLAQGDIAAWSYVIDLTPLKNRNAAAHSSWIEGERGVLMAADLLPISARAGTLKFHVPNGWKVYDRDTASLPDIRKAVVAIGAGWTQTDAIGVPVRLLMNGKWHFTSSEAAEMVQEIHRSHRNLFQHDVGPSDLIISNFPTATSHGSWEAETRGNVVTIISSDMPFRTQSLQRLHEQLRHELFHLWMPNGVNLTGNYDWFYEGFALYQSLKLAVGLNRIRFEDFLDTLSRAHTIDSAGSQRISLIQASTARFGGANTQVYARGMLVGFICDLALLEKSKGKKSVEDILRAIFVKHRKPAQPADGNTAVIAELKLNLELVPVVEKYVTGAEKMDWAAELAAAGIEDGDAGPITTLRVKQKLSGRQKTTLDKLGYNNWR